MKIYRVEVSWIPGLGPVLQVNYVVETESGVQDIPSIFIVYLLKSVSKFSPENTIFSPPLTLPNLGLIDVNLAVTELEYVTFVGEV